MIDELISTRVLKSVLDAIPQGLVMVNSAGNIIYFNPYAEMALGIRASDALGHHFREVFCPSLPLNQCWVNIALLAATPLRQHRFEMERPNGQRHLLEANFTPLRDQSENVIAAIISINAINGSSPLTERLQQTEETRDAILASITDGLFTVDHEWRITSFNRAAERMTGFRESEVLGKFCSQVLKTDRCHEGCPLATTLEHHQSLFDYEVTIHDRNDQPQKISVNTAVLNNRDGTPIGGIVSFRDTTLLKKLQADLQTTTQFEGMVGRHKKMLEIYELITEVADSDATVLIMGESGTGKELVANAIVRRSRRRDKPFVKVNCSVFPETLLESELFGHVKGAFTDARQDRLGRFELANGGTIFLDEVGEMSANAQLKLLRVLEEEKFERVGSSTTIKVDVRVIAATNQNLPHLVQEKRFREDLYYRLNVIPIVLPPLRERRTDLPLLVDHFLTKYRLLTGKPITQLGDAAMDLLMRYDYPGNVRELENAIEHAFARTTGNVITEQKLPLAIRHHSVIHETVTTPEKGNGECERIFQALEQARWNRNRAARFLGISRITLWRRMKALGMVEENTAK
ncbi:MAG: sigma 54-interacting transcriptional regulator [candidate division KSB1 bacterium]|nr:sigma 54-interacting transcriptional regulator [candidate division KSB1 bacterium]MDZ7304376.1 sigma 54-interacting transcriptional regulator [candidate division KSB1 bacterium]MDZ7313525.1 sigma 54-interacting transcriptional regulator [candidate division KSB1 bacterium]